MPTANVSNIAALHFQYPLKHPSYRVHCSTNWSKKSSNPPSHSLNKAHPWTAWIPQLRYPSTNFSNCTKPSIPNLRHAHHSWCLHKVLPTGQCLNLGLAEEINFPHCSPYFHPHWMMHWPRNTSHPSPWIRQHPMLSFALLDIGRICLCHPAWTTHHGIQHRMFAATIETCCRKILGSIGLAGCTRCLHCDRQRLELIGGDDIDQ